MTDLDLQLRRTFAAVAATYGDDPVPTRPTRRRRRRLAIGAGLTVAAVPLAAGASIVFGPEHVDEIPPPDPLLSGTLDGERWWVVDSFHTDQCDRPMAGIELIVEKSNIVGQEWNTVGYTPNGDGRCGTAAFPDEPSSAYYLDGGSSIGDGMLWMGWLPPEVDEVRADAGGKPLDVTMLPHEGHDFFVVPIPPGTIGFTVDFVADGQIVAPPTGDSGAHVVP